MVGYASQTRGLVVTFELGHDVNLMALEFGWIGTCHLASRYKQTDKHKHRDISSLCNLFFPPQTNDCIILPAQAFGFR